MRKSIFIVIGILCVAAIVRIGHLNARMTHVDDIGWLLQGFASQSAEEAARRVSREWTYAPGQFYFSWYLIMQAKSWPALLFLARLPSAVASVLGVFCFCVMLGFLETKKLSRPKNIFLCLLLSLSLRSIIEAQQAYNYASTLLSGSLLCLSLVRFPKPQTQFVAWTLRYFLSCSLAVFFCWFSYQNIASVPAMVAAPLVSIIFFQAFSPKLIIKALLVLGVAGSFATFRIRGLYYEYIEPLFRVGLGGTGWANESYPGFIGDNFFMALLNTIQHLVATQVKLLAYGLTPFLPQWSGTAALYTFGGILICIWFVGVLFILRPGQEQQRLPGLFAVLMLGANYTLHLMGKIPLGTTRHSHVVIIPNLVILYFGLTAIAEYVSQNYSGVFRHNAKAWHAGWVLLLLVFLAGYPAFHRYSRNNVDMAKVFAWEKEFKPVIVSGSGFTWENVIIHKAFPFKFMAAETQEAEIYEKPLLTLLNHAPGASMLLISHRANPLPYMHKVLNMGQLAQLEFENLAAIDPVGSTELKGIINAGNGFYVLRILKK